MILAVWLDGLRRVLRAPAVLAGVFVLTTTAALPLAMVLRGSIVAHLGRSLAADAAADGVNYDWWQEFASQASGVGATFSPAIVGFAATLDNLSGLLDAEGQTAPIAAALAAYLLAWTFLSGGVLDRYARQRPTRAYGFFGAAGVFFWRFLRLAAVAGAVYWFLFTSLHGWLLDDAYTRLTRDLSVERQAFAWRLILYGVFGASLVAANIVFDYARIRLVVEDRRSVLGALRAALAFIGRHPRRVLGLYAVNALAFLVLMAVWALVAPGVTRPGAAMWAGVALAQIYLLVRLALKLQFMASQTALFQASLAHARYTALPERAWPDSPAAEALTS
ncbi:MAG: hypothetical protein HY824_09635 [Acidobacteria bacterium]|nr:hypothetical protein [Acidobacteriota bacterium]